MNELEKLKKNTLIIKANSNDFIGKLIRDRGFYIESMYRGERSMLLRFLRRIFIHYKLPFYSIWFNKRILKYTIDNVLVFESLLSPLLIKWINKKMEVNIDVWYWNIVKNTISPNTLKESKCKLWSFSRIDAIDYGMSFNPPPYFNEIKCLSEEKRYDVVFVGKDKGRLLQLLYWKAQLEKKKLDTFFLITPDRKYNLNRNYSKEIPYNESVGLSCKSKAVFDYIEIDNSGQSMRMMESLFLGNKIITNNKLIRDYDFYNPKNIFILNIDNFDHITDFLSLEYSKIDINIVMKYDFDNFFLRFYTNSSNWWNSCERVIR